MEKREKPFEEMDIPVNPGTKSNKTQTQTLTSISITNSSQNYASDSANLSTSGCANLAIL